MADAVPRRIFIGIFHPPGLASTDGPTVNEEPREVGSPGLYRRRVLRDSTETH